jgi:hypothetical protein
MREITPDFAPPLSILLGMAVALPPSESGRRTFG